MKNNLSTFLVVLVGALTATALAADGPQPRMPRGPAAELHTQVLTIEGSWGYPCAIDWRCGMPPEERWAPLEVVAWVGNERFVGAFTGWPDDRGPFEVTVDVAPGQLGDMVMVEVLVESPLGHTARFQSLQDTAGRLLEEAGPGRRVGNTAQRPNQVTVLSTALVGLLKDGNGGDWRMGEARLMALLQQVDPARMMRHAQVFQGINLGILPGGGVIDPNALIASVDAIEAYLQDVDDDHLDSAYFSFHSGGETAFQEVDFAALDVTMIPAAAPGTVAFGRREGVRMRMNDEWSGNGFMSSVLDTGRTGGAGAIFLVNTDSFPRSARVVRPGNPSLETQRIRIDCPGAGLMDVLRLTMRMPSMFRRMAIAGGLEFVEFTEDRSFSYRLIGGGDAACLDGLPAFGGGPQYYVAHPIRRLGRGRDALLRHHGAIALQLMNPNPDLEDEESQFIAGVIDLASGDVSAPGYAAQGAVQWKPDGMLNLTVDTLPGSAREGQVELRMERVRGDGLGAEEWMLSTRLRFSADDHLRAHVTPVVRLDPAWALTPQRLHGRWRSGADLSWPGRVEAFTVDIDASSGQGMELPVTGPAVPFSWRVEDGHMVASTFALALQPDVLLPACPPDTEDCHEVRRRVWEPLREATGDALRRLYVIEETHIDSGDGLAPASRKLNFYDEG